MRQVNRRRTWVLALVLGAAALSGSIGLSFAGGPTGQPQAGYINPPPPPLSVAH